jgi:hypothetical protein
MSKPHRVHVEISPPDRSLMKKVGGPLPVPDAALCERANASMMRAARTGALEVIEMAQDLGATHRDGSVDMGTVYETAHELRGMTAMIDRPQAGLICDVICCYLDKVDTPSPELLQLLSGAAEEAMKTNGPLADEAVVLARSVVNKALAKSCEKC